jgi:hypothetical protein
LKIETDWKNNELVNFQKFFTKKWKLLKKKKLTKLFQYVAQKVRTVCTDWVPVLNLRKCFKQNKENEIIWTVDVKSWLNLGAFIWWVDYMSKAQKAKDNLK